MFKAEVKQIEKKLTRFREMQNGDIGFIRSSTTPQYNGRLVMRCSLWVFSLESEPVYWSVDADHGVELLRSGSQVILDIA